MNARERLQDMIRIERGDMNVYSPPEVRTALDAYRDEVLAEYRAAFTMDDARGIARTHRASVIREAIQLIDEHPHPGDHPAQFYCELLADLLPEGEKSSREADATPVAGGEV